MDLNAFFNTVITIFLLLSVGYVLGKAKILQSSSTKVLSKLIISIGQPALIINSITTKTFSNENLSLSLISLGAGILIHIIMAIIAYFACMKIKDSDERKITEFAMVFGNVGFLGIPILGSLFPENGEFVASFFVVAFNILLWIIGFGIIARGRKDLKLTLKKVLLNKGTVPSLIGYAIFLMSAFIPSFKMPVFISSCIGYIASLCTPVSMLVIGILLSERTVKQIFVSKRMYYMCAFKLILFPLAFAIIMKLFGFSDFWVVFIAATAAMPSAGSTSMFADLYDTAPGFSAQCVGTSTLLSIATMPAVVLLTQQILKLNISIF